MDAVSEILSGVRLNGALFFNAEFSAPWGVKASHSSKLAPSLAPGSKHLVLYHFISDGIAYARCEGESLQLVAGDVVVFPHGHAHVITSEATAEVPDESPEVNRKVVNRDLSLLQAGGGGPTTRVVCGFMACDPHLTQPILNGLPNIVRVSIRGDNSGRWLENSILHLVEEAASGQVGSSAMLAKLSEALFVDTLRRHIAGLSDSQRGWLAGARDSVVGKCLTFMHQRVAHPWTIADLADAVGISRSGLVERFTRYLSEPPMTYLTRWRLHLAARSLVTTTKGVAEIASEVGYDSEAAFNRAFKREFGVPPAQYRREKKEAKADAAAGTSVA